ncbi:MAG: hypothetical protein M1840_006180 [Geoglossum simile]|nr:MAG: hypothetical protein M1840_006180 [Geoglossum simile]
MAHSLPTYEEATSRDHWRLVGPYLHPQDLSTACLVSRKWFKLFTPLLWETPSSQFADRVGASYVRSFLKFILSLNTCRQYLRQLIRTMDLSELHPNLRKVNAVGNRDINERAWLRHLLLLAPRLQSLILSDCPKSLAEIRGIQQSELCLLNASFCHFNGLSDGLSRLPVLVYLDLSSTKSAGTWDVIRQITSLHRLQILKLRGVGLQDAHMEALARSLGARVWSLDVRDNSLSDMCIDALLANCFLPSDHGSNGMRELQEFLIALQTATEIAQDPRTRVSGDQNNAQGQDVASPPPPFSDTVRSEPSEPEEDNDTEAYMISYLASRAHAQIELSERPRTGLTHLYVAGNGFTISGVAQLIRTGRLKLFDCGIVRANNIGAQFNLQARVQGLVQELAYSRLTYLRIDHRILGGEGGPRSPTTTYCNRHSGTLVDDELELMPSVLPSLRHLVLTGVPTEAKSEHFTDALKVLLHRLAEQEQEISRKEAEDAALWASLPPSIRAVRRRERVRNAHPKKGLQRLDLEMDSGDQRRSPYSLWQSVTEDADGETFHQASANDFSFFDNPDADTTIEMMESDDEGSLSHQIMDLDLGTDDDRQTPQAAPDEPIRDFGGDVEMTSPSSPPPSYEQVARSRRDVKDIVVAFRRERREAFKEEVRMGRGTPGAGGHWSGNLRILRNEGLSRPMGGEFW